MSRTRFELVSVRSAAEFEEAAQIDPYQLVTGPGALGLVTGLKASQIEACFKNCALTISVGPDGREVEDALDDVSIQLHIQLQSKDDAGFFPTISDPTFDDNVWIVIHQLTETPRLLALSTESDFGSQVASWIDRATAEAAE